MDPQPQTPQPPSSPLPPQGPVPPTSSGSSHAKVLAAGIAATAQRVPRKYPKPPGFFRWLGTLCVKPESWAQAARYPTYVTLAPLLVVIVLGGLVAFGVPTLREYWALKGFATSYDKNYPALELTSDSTLRVAAGGQLKSPVRVPAGDQVVLVDPTNATKPESVSWDHTYALVTDKYVYFHREQANPFTDEEDAFSRQTISECNAQFSNQLLPLPEQGKAMAINGTSIGSFMDQRIGLFVAVAAFRGAVLALGDLVWAAVMIFIMSTVIMQVTNFQGGAEGGRKVRSLVLPRRAAVRMVAGLLVPLVVVSTILKSTGGGIADMLGWYAAPAFWMAAAMGLSVWTGMMARRMFAARLAS